MKLQRLTNDFAPHAHPLDPRFVRLETYFLPVAAAAAAALAFIAWLLRE